MIHAYIVGVRIQDIWVQPESLHTFRELDEIRECVVKIWLSGPVNYEKPADMMGCDVFRYIRKDMNYLLHTKYWWYFCEIYFL